MTILKIFTNIDKFYDQRRWFKSHRRLKVFWLKGKKCVHCNTVGNVIIKSRDKGGQINYDLYRCNKHGNGRVLMTVDHIIPKCLGGTWNIENLQPMCCKCNQRKGDTLCLPYIEEKNNEIKN